MDETKYFSTSKTREVLGISYSTLRRWEEQGKIKAVICPSGRRLYDVLSVTGKEEVKARSKICYCRVSTQKQIKDLDRQVEYCKEKYPSHEIIKDIGSAFNWRRKGLITLLDRTLEGNVEEVVIAHRDRLCRFGFELLCYLFEKNRVKLVVLDQNTKTDEQQFTSDIIAIITVFSNRYYGKRKYSNTNKKTKTNSKSTTKKDIHKMDGNIENVV